MRTFPDAITFCLSAATSALMGRRYLSCLWELTYRCTARCSICNYWKSPGRAVDELSLAEITRGLDLVFAYGCRLVNFTGGEPTLRHDLEQIVAHASRLGMWTSVVTNGSLLSRERVRGLRKAGLDNLLVSLDSVSPAAHDQQRGIPGLHARVDACANWIREEFLYGHRTGGVMCVLSRRNRQELEGLAGFARERGVFVLFQPYHANKTGDIEQVPEMGDAEICQLLSLNRGAHVLLNSRGYLRGLNRSRQPVRASPCHAGRKYLSVDPFGHLHPCVDMPAVGHILADELSVVRSSAAQEMISKCRGCWYCFRGEADTSLSVLGCLEKAWLGVAVLRHNAGLRARIGATSSTAVTTMTAASRDSRVTQPGVRTDSER